MRGHRSGRWGALAGAVVIVTSLLLAGPALADEAPSGAPGTAQTPADTHLVDGADQGTTGPEDGTPADAQAPGQPATQVTAAAAAAPGNCIGRTAAYGSTVCFVPGGDVVWVLDTQKDGMSAAAGIYTDYGRGAEACLNKSGVNHWVKCDFNYSEKGNIQLRAFRYDSGTGKFYVPETYSDWIPVDGKY